MKKVFVSVLTLLIVVVGSFAVGRLAERSLSGQSGQESSIRDNGFRTADYPAQSRCFVIYICGFNNGAFLEKTLRSVFSQIYDNYRLIYIDDASTDGSDVLARDCINQSGYANRAAFVHNEQRLGVLANLVRAVQVCKDHEIVMVLQGQDWLAHEWVLSRLNQYYADADLWLTYGQYREFPSYRLGIARNYQESEWKTLRQSPFMANHLPTFYAALFKQIKETDLLFQGTYFMESAELAFMLPMLEMAQDHFQFVSEILSLSNQRASSQDNRDLIRTERTIRSLKPYSPLTALRLETVEELDHNQEAGT
jgi:glycosyltransferase involved in cell wall biosynthesis